MSDGHDPRDDPASSEGESGQPAGRPETGATREPVEPDLTADELEVGWGERPHESGRSTDSDEWLLRERPPHWE